MTDLDAIRARDAAEYAPGTAEASAHAAIRALPALLAEVEVAVTRLSLARQALVDTGYFSAEEVGSDVAPRITEYAAHMQAELDALLAEVDRLTKEVAYMTFTGAGIPMTGRTAQAACDYLDRTITQVERARIRVIVADRRERVIDPVVALVLDNILAAIDGEAT